MSGDRYHAVGGFHQVRNEHFDGSGASVVIVDTHTNFVAPGPNNNFRFKSEEHITVNSNGEVTSQRFEFKEALCTEGRG